MAPAAVVQTPSVGAGRPASPPKRGWTEERPDIPSILVGRGQENASTARHNLEQGMDSERKSSENTRIRGRQNSLKRTKNSTDVLRQRSLKRDGKAGAADSNHATREGRQFTVANVGNNGKIYLRPTTRTAQKSPMPPSAYPVAMPAKSYGHDTDMESSIEKKRWSDTQASRTPIRPRRTNSIDRGTQRSNSMSIRSAKLSRSGSVSTIGGGNNLESAQVKVVINQTDPALRYPEEKILPSLEVPIPHYRLGTPRFSTRGTAFLHSQVYSRASTADDHESSIISGPEYDTIFPVPPGVETHLSLSRGHPHNVPQQYTAQTTPAAARIPITTASPVYHRAREPIIPAIYDSIAANPDDPAIVRYAMSTREISAASPARLIAQITSKNFLDYELLSDFFLTVRAYLSTHDLLDYLLTRFEWAVNRFDDDGRVIRVRAFAAIRHWVLNYFPYDFVVDRDLRVKFCQHLNTLTHQVRLRSSHEPSDLKLIIDLKKCWNGRCALYWDNPLGDVDGRNDLDISPGGIVGSRDSRLTHPSELWARIAESSSQQVDQAKSVAALHNWVDSVIEAEDQGKAKSDRGVSVTTSRSFSMSTPLSEQSIQAMSCSIPGKTLKAFATQSQRNVGPHPIPTTSPPAIRRVGPAAPSAQANEKPPHLKQGHERSGSFSDALRDKRTSLPLQPEHSTEQAVMTFPFSGSLIRGSVLPPASPFIENLAHQKSTSSLPKHSGYVDGLDGSKVTVRPMSPGVKNLLGTIRRAIGSKQNSSTPTPALLSTAPFMVEMKDSTLPMHIAYKIEGFGDQHHQLEALKNNSRIDLLCADITDMFERAMTQEPRQMTRPLSSTGVASGNERQQPSSDPRQLSGTLGREALQRGQSEMTNGSQSIVIVDDTAMEPPVPSLPQEFQNLPAGESSREFSRPSFPMTDHSTSPLPAAFKPLVVAQPHERESQNDDHTATSVLLPPFTIPVLPSSPPEHQSSRISERINRVGPSHQPRPSIGTGRSYISYGSSRSGPKSLRKYASYQSGMRTSGPDRSVEPTTASDSPQTSSKGQFDQPAGRMLRRRPGGDLRANQSVHDLEPIPRPKSTGSITTFTDSMHSSGAFLQRIVKNSQPILPAPAQAAPVVAEKAISLMSSRPSQPDLRPSFEAAVAEFARIPDDEGGDLEATLAKLEGKFRKSPVASSGRPSNAGAATIVNKGVKEQYGQQSQSSEPQNKEHGLPLADAMLTPPGTTASAGPSGQAGARNDHRDTMRSLYAESEESYNCIPLLERGLNQKARETAQTTSDQSNVTVPRPLFSPSQPNGEFPKNDQAEESSLAAEDDDIGSYEAFRARYRSSMPTCTTDSFLLDEDEFLSDLSSELSEDSEAPNEALEEAYGSSARFMHGGMLPPNVGYAQGYLPSPPMTTENAMAITSETNRIQEQRKPPTPEPSPVSRITDPGKSRSPGEVDGSVLQPFANTVHQFPPRRHIPFILAYDAAILAQQLTIIERDGLNEINWQDLIDMRWQPASTQTLNWVEYLRYQEPTGIELVTARFNIIVKWALSEIVLTQNIEERALAIIKYIHIAQHARKYHNYATVVQITIALTSVDCARLTRTWDLVPAAEKAMLKEMETLAMPIKNFHKLRQDMEAANLDEGCIPFVPLYIHDLTYNAQKPSVVASTRDSEPLINFERFRTAATIVKSLLRLIDASAKYDFRPVEGALERCLWMASLSDDMIRIKSRDIEP
ncbi:MAG: Guanine nucleotide exchange factor lte1 [Alectoria sarmentosa]|nr:MAG: Guanine nucleotide exchange factor lte1 [Alectoria sarmentosa]CAD6580138.1 MAG: Guanine nucleotide exchange factor lte1 [Alectoria sarmentosa]